MARNKRGRATDATKVALDMTPMIDVTFNLIIFFMIVSEISQQDLEMLELPRASEAIADEDVPKDRMIVNVVKSPTGDGSGKYYVKGLEYFLDQRQPRLASVLKTYSHEEKWWEKDPEKKEPPLKNVSFAYLLVRADKDVNFRAVQEVLKTCVDPNEKVMIWRIQIAIKKVQK